MVDAGDFADATTMTTQATDPLPEPPEAPSSRRLTRSTSDRVIAGVAGGLGRYFSIDPVVVRIAFIVGAFFLSRTYTPPLYVYLGLAVAAARVELAPSGQELPGATGRDWRNIGLLTLAGVILVQVLIRLWS